LVASIVRTGISNSLAAVTDSDGGDGDDERVICDGSTHFDLVFGLDLGSERITTHSRKIDGRLKPMLLANTE